MNEKPKMPARLQDSYLDSQRLKGFGYLSRGKGKCHVRACIRCTNKVLPNDLVVRADVAEKFNTAWGRFYYCKSGNEKVN